MTTTTMPEKVHHGRAVKRLRELLHVKQETLADALGISQQSVSLLETKETIEPSTLEQIAKALNLPVEAIKSFDEEKAIYAIQNNYDNAIAHNNFQYQPNFNPLDKYIEAIEEIKKLHQDNKNLYETLLKEKDEKIALLEKMLAGKK